MSEEALVDHIFVRLEPQVQDYVEVRNPQNTVQLLEVLSKFEERYSCAKQCGVRGIVIMLKDEVGMSVGCLMLMIVGEIGGIRKFCVDRVTAEMIIGFREMIEDFTIEDTNLEMGVKMTILQQICVFS
ncbi:uncharacterized protein TNCV_4262301 [Trichonephila clavipes]|nr:uncharacterized protein TNCV_4262301 [Trichonephila clavipes]